MRMRTRRDMRSNNNWQRKLHLRKWLEWVFVHGVRCRILWPHLFTLQMHSSRRLQRDANRQRRLYLRDRLERHHVQHLLRRILWAEL